MAAVPPTQERFQHARLDSSGQPIFEWSLTSSDLRDTVRLIVGPFNVLPVIFVPGIMGSNLKSKAGGAPVWRLDTGIGNQPWGLVKGFARKGPGPRQQLLHPDRCEVDDGGAVPSGRYSQAVYKEKGWGEVGEGPYQEYLLWLEDKLNPFQPNPALWSEYYQAQATVSAPSKPGERPKLFPGIRMGMHGEPFGAEKTPFESIMTDDLMKRAKLMMPVYACGYNWLGSNDDAARRLQTRIEELIRHYNQGEFHCEQVVLVTHSMGGLVARACAQLSGMEDKIAGIVHGVMPSNGAAVAYRRCKVGMRDENFKAGWVIGSTGQEVTAVFAQAPGALQLLPAHTYAKGWLRIDGDNKQRLLELPDQSGTAYDQIYRERNRWWGLVNEEWLSPKDGKAIDWRNYSDNIDIAEQFHNKLIKKYHPNSYVIYGADPKQPSFEKVTWRVKRGWQPRNPSASPSIDQVKSLPHGDIRNEGQTPGYVGGSTEIVASFDAMYAYETSHWELHCEMQDGLGDGTVPLSSGAAPLAECAGAIQQQFKLTGFGHEPAYTNGNVKKASLYSINKIAGKAKISK